jgi:hypothetical protein
VLEGSSSATVPDTSSIAGPHASPAPPFRYSSAPPFRTATSPAPPFRHPLPHRQRAPAARGCPSPDRQRGGGLLPSSLLEILHPHIDGEVVSYFHPLQQLIDGELLHPLIDGELLHPLFDGKVRSSVLATTKGWLWREPSYSVLLEVEL